jgi:hypothetical protein
MYAGGFGARPPVPAVVVGIGEKNGRRVYDVRLEGESSPMERDRWGYEDQITMLEPYSPLGFGANAAQTFLRAVPGRGPVHSRCASCGAALFHLESCETPEEVCSCLS